MGVQPRPEHAEPLQPRKAAEAYCSDRELEPFRPLHLCLHPDANPVVLRNPGAILGRHSSADVRLILPDVSRKHCRFQYTAGTWQVEDLASTNGLFLNGVKIERAVLRSGDELQIGSYVFRVYYQDSFHNPERLNRLVGRAIDLRANDAECEGRREAS